MNEGESHSIKYKHGRSPSRNERQSFTELTVSCTIAGEWETPTTWPCGLTLIYCSSHKRYSDVKAPHVHEH